MNYQFNLNKAAIEVKSKATFTWQANPQAHEGGINLDGTQVNGFRWTDQTIANTNFPELMGDQIPNSKSLDQAFRSAANQLSDQFKETLSQARTRAISISDRAPENGFDYSAIADSQALEFNAD